MKLASDPKDVQDFLFKQTSTRQVFDGFKTVPEACDLVASDGKRGLLYVGHDNKITILRCNGQTANEWKFEHEFPQIVSRIALSCDNEYLSVTFHKSTARIYNARSLTSNNLELIHETQLSSTCQDVYAYDLKWNPAIAGMFCTVASDHTIGSFMVKTERKTTVGLVALERLEGHEILCVAWSPKGKQIAAGCKNGNIIQLKPDLKIARTIIGPSPSVGCVTAILWISNYQFCATYQDPNDRSIKVTIVDAPKGEPKGIFTCYDDITYGMPETESSNTFSRYYLDHVAEWGLIIAASSSSTEVAVLGTHDNGTTWEQWQLVDSGRAQLPLIRTTESYPVGLTIDRSSNEKLILGPETTLPQPVPILHIFGTSGQLVSFHMVYLTPNCPSLCSPPTEIVTAVQIQPPRPNLATSEISFSMNTALTSTPRPKQAEIPVDRPKILPSVNLFNDPAKTNIQAPAIVQQTELKIRKPRPEKIEPAIAKTEQRLSPVKEIAVQPEKPAIDEGLCLRAYFEEQMLFEKELKSKLEPQVWECGTDDEQRKLVTQSSVIDEFLRELRETTNSLSSDVAALKALLLQSFAWLEETKSKNSPNFTDNPRDRGDRNKIKELEKIFFNIRSQLLQATKALDVEWADQESRGRTKIEVPRLEFIYQSLKSHSEIIAREKILLEQQLRKWKSLTRGNKVPGLNRSMAKLNISSSFGSTGKNNDGGAIEMRCKAIANNTRSFSLEKQLKLRELLMETKPRVIKAITPSPVQDRLEATLSSLASFDPIANRSKNKIERTSSERTVSKDETTSNIVSQPSPLASLNNIVAKFGPTNESASQIKPQIKPFTMSNTTAPLFVAQPPQSDKKQLNIPQIQSKPKQTNAITINPTGFTSQMPSNPRTQAFSEVQSISFGPSESKIQEQSASTTSNDNFSTSIKLPPSKDNFSIEGSTFFKDTSPKPATPLSTASPITKNESQNVTSSFGPKLTYQGVPEGTTIQEVITSTTANFGNSGQSTKGPKNPVSDATPATTGLQSFSFVSKPIEPPAFSFALKDPVPVSQTLAPTAQTPSPTTQTPAQAASELPGLFDLGLSSIGNQPTFGKFAMPTSAINFGDATSTSPTTAVSSPPVTSPPAQSSQASSTVPTTPNIFSMAAAGLPTKMNLFDKIPSTGSSIFSGVTSTTASSTSMFGGGTSGLTGSMFGGPSTTNAGTSLSTAFNVTPAVSTTSVAAVPTASSPPPSIFSVAAASTFGKPTGETTGTPVFGKSSINFSASTFGNVLGTTSTSVNFGTAAAAAANSSPVVKTPEASPAASVFSQTPVSSVASPNNLPQTPTTAAPTNLFGGATSTATIGSSRFGSTTGSLAPAIFGGGATTTGPTTAFDDNSAAKTPFGTMFGCATEKPFNNCFGGTSGNTFSMFGGGGGQQTTTSPTGPQTAGGFEQSSGFGNKPVFGGQTSVFGAAKPEFSNPFGTTTFGTTAVPTGFSGAPAMGGSPPPLGTASMQKVFGNPVGVSTFESLAGQNGELTFGSLAQKTPEPPKPSSFSGGSSFSSWR